MFAYQSAWVECIAFVEASCSSGNGTAFAQSIDRHTMSSALINDLKSLVLGEQRSISAEWLANHARVTVHETQKCVLQDKHAAFESLHFRSRRVLKEFAAGPGKASTRILYYVSGLTPAGSMRICLVPESGVQGIWCITFLKVPATVRISFMCSRTQGNAAGVLLPAV